MLEDEKHWDNLYYNGVGIHVQCPAVQQIVPHY
jgi:hypothetical protein